MKIIKEPDKARCMSKFECELFVLMLHKENKYISPPNDFIIIYKITDNISASVLNRDITK